MKADELKQKYLGFFTKKRHKILPNVSLVPENDPTTLFISAGMQPLVPYLLGEPHPSFFKDFVKTRVFSGLLCQNCFI